MKVIIDNCEVEIRAKNLLLGRERMNRRDTEAIVNLISLWAREAAASFADEGYDALAKRALSAADATYDALDKRGCYDRLNH